MRIIEKCVFFNFMTEEKISLREFARRLNVGEKTIRDGIKSGKISKGVEFDEKGKPKIIFSTAVVEANEIGLGKKVLQKEISSDKQSKPTPNKSELHYIELLPYNEALRKKENYIAKIKELEFKEKEGSLLNKDEIFAQLFDFHQELRNSLLSIPDRITDTIIAYAHDRNRVHQLINESIAGELDKLKRFAE